MILVASVEKPFDYTPKMSRRRKVVLKAYETEIENTYAAKEASTLQIKRPDSWSCPASILAFVRRVVHEVVRGGEELDDTDGLFSHGCDSLQATYIRNTIIKALDDSNITIAAVPMNFVYLHPSVLGLASYLSLVASNEVAVETLEKSMYVPSFLPSVLLGV